YFSRRVTSRMTSIAVNKIIATAYTEIRKLRTDNQTYASLLTYLLRRRDGGSGRFPTDSEFSESFATRDSYHLRPSYRRYLFDVLENGDSKDSRDIASGIDSGDLTIEHIMPQTLTHAWEDELGDDAERIHETWQKNIGNRTFTGYNSAYSNSYFTRKKDLENGFTTSPYRLNEDVKTAQRWEETAMVARSARLTKEVLQYWSFIDTDFAPPEVVRP